MVSEACLSGNKDCAHGEWCQKHVCLVTGLAVGNGVRSMSGDRTGCGEWCQKHVCLVTGLAVGNGVRSMSVW